MSDADRRGVPRLRLANTFDSFDVRRNPGMREALAQCRKVAARQHWCAFLTGETGTGKTHLAIAAMHQFGFTRSYFWSVPDWLDWVKDQAFGDDGRPLSMVLEPFMTGDFLLVFDDVGTENPTHWACEQLYRVLNRRCDEEVPTILTTNRDADAIDVRIRSRYASGKVVCKGTDQRRAGS